MFSIQTRHRPKLISHPLVTRWEHQGDPVLRLAFGLIVAITMLLAVAGTALGQPAAKPAPASSIAFQNPSYDTDWQSAATLRARLLMMLVTGRSTVYASLPHRRQLAGFLTRGAPPSPEIGRASTSPDQQRQHFTASGTGHSGGAGSTAHIHLIFSLLALALVLATGAVVFAWVKFT
ncbi:MAG: hypothetical protein ACC634_03195, partial [Hyphomicrobiales bacterium]